MTVLAVVEHVRDPLGGVAGVDGHERRAGLRDRPGGEDRLDRSWDCHGDSGFRPGTVLDQHARQLVGAGVEIAIGQFPPVGEDCGRVGVARRARDEDVRERARCGRGGATGHGVLGVVEQVDAVLRRAETGREEAVQEPEEPTVLRPQFGVVVQVGVGLEVDVRAGAADTRVEVDEQVFDQARREHVHPPDECAELDAAVEGHDVDRRPETCGMVGGVAAVAEDVLLAVALAAQRPGEFALGGADQLAHRGFGAERHPDRDDVGDHAAGAAQARGRARGHGQAQGDVVGSGHPGQVGTERGGDHRRDAGVRLGGNSVQQCGGVGRQGRADQSGMRVGGADLAGASQAHRVGRTGEMLGPVVAIGVEPLGVAVGDVTVDDRAQIFGTRCGGVGAGHRGGVQLGGARHHRHRGEPVERDVVDAGVPEVAVLAHPQHRGRDQTVGQDIQRRCVFGTHPVLRVGLRVGGVAQVDVVGTVVQGVVDALERHTVDLHDAQEAGAEFATGLCARIRERLEVQFVVDRSVDLHELCDRDRHHARDMLGEPDSALGRREREDASLVVLLHGYSLTS